jgi:ankyrin repeat protein
MAEDTVWNASIFGELEILKKLCENEEAPIHEADDRGFTPLCWAARNGHNPVLTYLIDKKCSMEQGSFAGMKPLHHACNKNLESTVKLLLAAGAEVTRNLIIPIAIATTICHLTHTLIITMTTARHPPFLLPGE